MAKNNLHKKYRNLNKVSIEENKKLSDKSILYYQAALSEYEDKFNKERKKLKIILKRLNFYFKEIRKIKSHLKPKI